MLLYRNITKTIQKLPGQQKLLATERDTALKLYKQYIETEGVTEGEKKEVEKNRDKMYVAMDKFKYIIQAYENIPLAIKNGEERENDKDKLIQ